MRQILVSIITIVALVTAVGVAGKLYQHAQTSMQSSSQNTIQAQPNLAQR